MCVRHLSVAHAVVPTRCSWLAPWVRTLCVRAYGHLLPHTSRACSIQPATPHTVQCIYTVKLSCWHLTFGVWFQGRRMYVKWPTDMTYASLHTVSIWIFSAGCICLKKKTYLLIRESVERQLHESLRSLTQMLQTAEGKCSHLQFNYVQQFAN